MRYVCMVFLMTLLLGACETAPRRAVWQLSEASRADGTVTLTTDYSTKVSYHSSELNKMAAQKCAVWGYKGAQSFGQEQRSCLVVNRAGSCQRFRLTAKYQCTGSPTP